jgi:DNA helicase-2/ATP-dependent DNA helicase PcrA
MTIHLAKGLEFPHVYIVGLEEDLFPSALSSTTRSDLEEERRLFYVALTRAEKKITLTYAKTRYRWGKLNDCEPSRFINEIDSNYINHNFSKSKSLFQSSSSSNSLRFKKPEKKSNLKALGKKKHVTDNISGSIEGFKDLKIGDYIIHNRFGKGKVIETEGVKFDKKAEVEFDTSGVKKILLKFAKYEIISN